MKAVKLCVFLYLIFPNLAAQQLTGFWMGKLDNDSSKKKQHFELALSEYKGKVTGYSYTTFIENDHYYYSIKQIKATRDDSTWVVEDDKMVANNFPEKAAKGVRQTSIFNLNKKDSLWQMNGRWRTNKTKMYFSIGGKLQMDEEKDFSKSNLFPHLAELNIKTIGSYQSEKAEEHEKENNELKKEPAIAGRLIEIIQTVSFKSDSLVLALYDNGEIDGDTVSVYLNKELILSEAGLKATAIKKTIYFSAQKSDSLQLILFAENLGRYPPNTGLLIVRDGEDIYHIRFSADLQRSPAIVFKKKQK